MKSAARARLASGWVADLFGALRKCVEKIFEINRLGVRGGEDVWRCLFVMVGRDVPGVGRV